LYTVKHSEKKLSRCKKDYGSINTSEGGGGVACLAFCCKREIRTTDSRMTVADNNIKKYCLRYLVTDYW